MRHSVLELFDKMFHINLKSLVWRRHVCVPLRGTNMAAGNTKKHLEFTFARKEVCLPLSIFECLD